MLKRGLALLLALVMLASVSVAGAAWSEVKVDGHHKYVSVADWSKADIEKAIKLNLDVAYTGENVQMSIARVDFAEDAAALVGLAYGQDIRTYERYNELQVLLNKAEKKDVWREMGILKGRGNGYYVDPNTPITRQEAAVVLARVYRLYAEEPQTKAIAPNFVGHGTGILSRICSKLLRLAGIHFEHQWTESEYLHWLQTHGWDVTFSKLLPSRIPLLYTECVRSYAWTEEEMCDIMTPTNRNL